MICPGCGSRDTKVRDTRNSGEDVIRRRLCRHCGRDWFTLETMMPYEDGRIEINAIHRRVDAERRRKEAYARWATGSDVTSTTSET